jgi:hypothetical protein
MDTIQRTWKVLCLVRYEFCLVLYFAYLNCSPKLFALLDIKEKLFNESKPNSNVKAEFCLCCTQILALHPKYIMD